MKKFLIVGAALMAGASIYGFVDYNKTKRSKEFSRLYNETENRKTDAALPEPAKDSKTAVAVKTESTIVKKEAVKNTNKSKPAVIKTPVKRKIEKPGKLSHKLFSRAPLKEDYMEKTIKIELPKTESVKTQPRGQ
jgi:hypothetical protein